MEIFELREDYLIDQDDGLKKLMTWFFNLVMQLEAIQQSGAEPYERNETRTAQRNGYKERSLKTARSSAPRSNDIYKIQRLRLYCLLRLLAQWRDELARYLKILKQKKR